MGRQVGIVVFLFVQDLEIYGIRIGLLLVECVVDCGQYFWVFLFVIDEEQFDWLEYDVGIGQMIMIGQYVVCLLVGNDVIELVCCCYLEIVFDVVQQDQVDFDVGVVDQVVEIIGLY